MFTPLNLKLFNWGALRLSEPSGLVRLNHGGDPAIGDPLNACPVESFFLFHRGEAYLTGVRDQRPFLMIVLLCEFTYFRFLR